MAPRPPQQAASQPTHSPSPTLIVIALAQLVAGAKAPQPGVTLGAEAACRRRQAVASMCVAALHGAWCIRYPRRILLSPSMLLPYPPLCRT